MSEENKEEFSVITDAEMDAQKKKSEEVDKLLTPPEGQVLDGLRSFCPIHGEITYANRTLEYTLFRKNEKGTVFPVTYRDVICEACLSDMWKEYCASHMPKGENGVQQGITVSPVFIPAIEAKEKEIKMGEELIEKLKKNNGSPEKIKKAENILAKLKEELAEMEKKEAEKEPAAEEKKD